MKEYIEIEDKKYTFKDYLASILAREPGWSYLGYLEWSDPNFHLFTDIFGSGDLVWISQQTGLTEEKWPKGVGVRYCVGFNPTCGDNIIYPSWFTVVDFLKDMLTPPNYGRTSSGGFLTRKMPEGVRLNGMKEFITNSEE